MNRIEVSNVKVGMRFSKPVFFDDGKNMFIESGITVKPYHVAALSKWNIPFLVTEGHLLAENEKPEEEIPEIEDAEELETLEELEDLEEL